MIPSASDFSTLPVGVIQFGEGNFLRAFADLYIDEANEKSNGAFGSVAVVKPRAGGSLEAFRRQNNRYTVLLRGLEGGKTVSKSRVVTSLSSVINCTEQHGEYLSLAACPSVKMIISNTTEAGIVTDRRDMTAEAADSVPVSYPGKLTKLLYHRFRALGEKGGVVILPTELIENNGGRLRECVVSIAEAWSAPEEFFRWLDGSCVFCSTLVDRIVTGYPKDGAEEIFASLGYEDELLTAAEPYGLWVIECPPEKSAYVKSLFPGCFGGIGITVTESLTPYRERKVRILNGAHTSSVSAAYLCGIGIVRDMMSDPLAGEFCRRAVLDEIADLVPLDGDDVLAFADDVFERFANPYIDHSLLAISLNSVSKWKTRILPSFRDYYSANGRIPPLLTFSFAALLAFCSGSELTESGLEAMRGDGVRYTVRDDPAVLRFFLENCRRSDFVSLAASRTDFWGEDLGRYSGFTEAVGEYLSHIRRDPRGALKKILGIGAE